MNEKRTYAFEAFTTRVSITLYGEKDACQEAFELAQRRCAKYESLFSRTRPGSDVWSLNHADGKTTNIDLRTDDLLRKAVHYCDASEGAFDITVGSLVGLWDFKQGQVADRSALEQAIDTVGYDALKLGDSRTASLANASAAVDLGGIAKGWIADALYKELSGFGLEGFVLDLGGNIIVGGGKPDGSMWKIGVKDPCDPQTNIAATQLEYGSVVTSGVYERAFVRDGKLYHHILDPKTGMPVDTDLLSATLVCDASIDAEGYSTTVLALGAEKAREFIRFIPEIRQAFLIDKDMRFYTYTQ